MAGVIGVYTYVTSDKKAHIRMIFETTVYDFEPTPENIKYIAAGGGNNNIYNENINWLYPEQNVSDLRILNNGKEIDFVINNPFLKTRIIFPSVTTVFRDSLVFDFVDNLYDNSRDHFVSVTTAGIIKVWFGTDNPKMPYRENLRAKIVNKENKVICIVGGYHVRNYNVSSYYFREWTSTQISLNNGIDIYRRFLPTVTQDELPADGEELYFVYDFSGEVFSTNIYYDSASGLFYKPIEDYDYEGWKLVDDSDVV